MKNFYITAEKSSSSPEVAEESKQIIDNLLRCNGYTDPRSFKNTHVRIPKVDTVNQDDTVCLKIPYVSEYVSYEILRYIENENYLFLSFFYLGESYGTFSIPLAHSTDHLAPLPPVISASV